MRTWLKEAARKKAESGLQFQANLSVPLGAGEQFDQLRAAKKQELMNDWEEQWGKDYDENVGAKLDDEDVRESAYRR